MSRIFPELARFRIMAPDTIDGLSVTGVVAVDEWTAGFYVTFRVQGPEGTETRFMWTGDHGKTWESAVSNR